MQGEKRGLNQLGFETAPGLGLELRPLELMRLPGLEVRQLRLVIELQRQLKLQLALELQLLELLKPSQERRLKPLVVALGLGPELGLQRESLDFEPALALGAPLLLWLLVELQKQLALVLVLVLEPQLVELLMQE
jgi:hypothetical protein